jgi:hypothetical protein
LDWVGLTGSSGFAQSMYTPNKKVIDSILTLNKSNNTNYFIRTKL